MYLELVARAEDVQCFVKDNPFGQPAITESHPDWKYYFRPCKPWDIHDFKMILNKLCHAVSILVYVKTSIALFIFFCGKRSLVSYI